MTNAIVAPKPAPTAMNAAAIGKTVIDQASSQYLRQEVNEQPSVSIENFKKAHLTVAPVDDYSGTRTATAINAVDQSNVLGERRWMGGEGKEACRFGKSHQRSPPAPGFKSARASRRPHARIP